MPDHSLRDLIMPKVLELSSPTCCYFESLCLYKFQNTREGGKKPLIFIFFITLLL